MKKKVLAMALALALCLSLLPSGVFAAFSDVPSDTWYSEAVSYVYDKGIMTGVSSSQFNPGAKMTRAQMCQILYNMEGKPGTGSAAFTDVSRSDWFYNAVVWAASKGIVSGVGGNSFAPNDLLSREQTAALLYRYAQYKDYDVSGTVSLDAFSDMAQISSWAMTAMQWAVGKDLISGTSDTTLTPGSSATRAQGAAILQRFDEKIVSHGVVNPPAPDFTADPLAIYDSLLKTYRAVVNKEKEWDPDELLGDPAFYNIYTTYYPKAGYAFLDINQDGVPELLLGPTSPISDFGNGLIYDLYTYRDGAVVKVAESAERDRYYLLDNGQLSREWSNGASDNGVDYYVLEKGATALKPAQNSFSSAKRSIGFISF